MKAADSRLHALAIHASHEAQRRDLELLGPNPRPGDVCSSGLRAGVQAYLAIVLLDALGLIEGRRAHRHRCERCDGSGVLPAGRLMGYPFEPEPCGCDGGFVVCRDECREKDHDGLVDEGLP